jgi:hypothetical protein
MIARTTRRLVRRLVTPLRQLDHVAGRWLGPRQVLFELRTPVNLAVLKPVLDVLRADRRVSCRITVEHPAHVARAISTAGLRPLMISRSVARWRRCDLYVNADPWAAVWLKRCARRMTFFHGVAGKYDLDAPCSLPMGFDTYDRVAFINEDRLERYLASGIVTRRQAVLVGYPKLDRLAQGAFDARDVRRSLGFDDVDRPVAIYAPTYSTASSLHLAGEDIVRTLLACGLNVIVKLHDRSLEPSLQYTGGIDWRARAHAWGAPGRYRFVEAADASPLLAAADLMITDHSSVGFEFLVLDRPLIVYDAPDLAAAARINPEKVQLLRSTADVVRTPPELAGAVRRALARPAEASTRRRTAASNAFFKPGTATRRALDIIYALLELPARVDARAPAISDASPATAAKG